jgi:hypothetical protein
MVVFTRSGQNKYRTTSDENYVFVILVLLDIDIASDRIVSYITVTTLVQEEVLAKSES